MLRRASLLFVRAGIDNRAADLRRQQLEEAHVLLVNAESAANACDEQAGSAMCLIRGDRDCTAIRGASDHGPRGTWSKRDARSTRTCKPLPESLSRGTPVPGNGGLVEVNDEWADVWPGIDAARTGEPCPASVGTEVDHAKGRLLGAWLRPRRRSTRGLRGVGLGYRAHAEIAQHATRRSPTTFSVVS